jgi:hypothetical protein
MKPTGEQEWMRLAGAARRARDTAAADAEPVPDREEIRRRLVSWRGVLREMLLTLLWRRWALAAVVVALVAYLIVYLLLGSGRPPEPPLLPLPHVP